MFCDVELNCVSRMRERKQKKLSGCTQLVLRQPFIKYGYCLMLTAGGTVFETTIV